MHRLLLAPGIQPEMRAVLDGRFEMFDMTGFDSPADVPGLDPATITAVVTKGESVFRERHIAALPNLKIIANFGVGYDGIEVQAAKARGVMVTHTPNVLTDETATTALLLALAVTRKLVVLDRLVRTGGWPTEPRELLANSIIGKTAGIIGLGRIGKAIARRLEACGAVVAYTDTKQQDVPYPFHPDPVALAKASDLLVVACQGGASTRHLVDATVLDALGPEGFLVNAARGTIVDEKALVAALKEGRIAGAGLDVFENEPHVPADLWTMDNVVLMPHRGSGTHETRRRMAELCRSNLDAFFAGQPLPTPVPEMRG
ncbi:2-hydroxyacid dehydrogenase [Shumkonia mesophila]|uniref:2-hydroxyacid dehydrogenase n=1 Tax=Shumkonia mesophila TaxID=2838854 RepID=UPI002935287E|nr:2-hydroxyacid dehydrogenase [Shumkonia mesophila]